jgi:hypothetical protein
MRATLVSLTFAVCVAAHALPASAVTVTFFNPSQPASLFASNTTSRTITSQGYRFTYTVDGYWSSYPGGPPTGRFFTVVWPDGVQAQAITAGTNVGIGANITLKRVDGQPFELRSFTGKLLANTAATGGAFEIMPQLNGEDAFKDPLMYDASGYAGMSFPHTPMLSGYDTYKLHLWVDWALTALTVVDSSELVPAALQLSLTASNTVQISWPAAAVGYVLQQSPSLEPADWTSVTNAAQLVDPNIQVTVPPAGGARFFRLQNP